MANPLLSKAWHEAEIVQMYLLSVKGGASLDSQIPLRAELDTIVTEMMFKHGRADIVIFHADGSATVIEVKDGTHGYNHVVSGIGQASLYAAQLGTKAGAVTKVRKALLWTSTGNAVLDGLICEACESANTIPIPWGLIDDHMNSFHHAMSIIQAKEQV